MEERGIAGGNQGRFTEQMLIDGEILHRVVVGAND